MLVGAFMLFGVTYVFSPMQGDQRSLVVAAQQADYYGSFPFNLGEVWYNRGLLHRAANYLLYKSTLLFCRYDDKTVFDPSTSCSA